MVSCTQARSKRETDAFKLIRYSRGFAVLPVELLHEIVSHLRRPIIPWNPDRYETYVYRYLMPYEHRARREVLRALCQVCRYLRSALFPLLWESLEACTARLEWQRCLDIGQELLGQLKLVSIGEQPYGSYVLVVVVMIPLKHAKAGLSALAHAMTLMPNLHTIHIICEYPATHYVRHGIWYNDFEGAFADHRYSSVRRAVLPVQATSALSCFPEVLDVHLNQNAPPDLAVNFIEALSRHCPKVEQFGWSEAAPNFLSIDAVIRYLPNVRILTLHGAWFVPSQMKNLSELQCLERTSITFVSDRSLLFRRVSDLIEHTQMRFSGCPRPRWSRAGFQRRNYN